jgi:hypothetical protein
VKHRRRMRRPTAAVRRSAISGTGVPGFGVPAAPAGWELAERLAIEFLPPRCRAPRCRAPATGARRSASLGHVTVLFRLLTGLADGLAPKERRHATGAIRPNNLGPPLPPLAQVASGAEIQQCQGGHRNSGAGPQARRRTQHFCKQRDLSGCVNERHRQIVVRAVRGRTRTAEGDPDRWSLLATAATGVRYSFPATLATNCATWVAWTPCTTSAGIVP